MLDQVFMMRKRLETSYKSQEESREKQITDFGRTGSISETPIFQEFFGFGALSHFKRLKIMGITNLPFLLANEY